MSSKLIRRLVTSLLVTFGFWAIDPGTTHAVIGGRAPMRPGGMGGRSGGGGMMGGGGMRPSAPKSIGAGKGTVNKSKGSGRGPSGGGIATSKPSDGDSSGGKKSGKK